jgi:hypothetical protein
MLLGKHDGGFPGLEGREPPSGSQKLPPVTQAHTHSPDFYTVAIKGTFGGNGTGGE